VVIAALLGTQLLQAIFYEFAVEGHPGLQWTLHWTVVLAALVLMALSLMANYRMVKNQLTQML
jgi:amino acid transporter